MGRDYDMNSLPPIGLEVHQVQQTVHSSVHSPPSSAPTGTDTDRGAPLLTALPLLRRPDSVPSLFTRLELPPAPSPSHAAIYGRARAPLASAAGQAGEEGATAADGRAAIRIITFRGKGRQQATIHYLMPLCNAVPQYQMRKRCGLSAPKQLSRSFLQYV